MRSSAMSNVVKRMRKMKKVSMTLPVGNWLTAALTGMRSWIIQGWRPISATAHPAWPAR